MSIRGVITRAIHYLREGISVSFAFASCEQAKGNREGVRPRDEERSLLNGDAFRRILAIERKRSERSGTPFLLMLASFGEPGLQNTCGETLVAIGKILLGNSRDTDSVGWYQDGAIVGAIFTGLADDQRSAILGIVAGRVKAMLESNLGADEWRQARLAFHLFPDDWDLSNPESPVDRTLYVDLALEAERKRNFLAFKRAIDIAISALALAVCSPLFLLTALAIKATSKGPVFFRQKRIGQHGKQFIFLKFRSMHAENNEHVHKEFVTGLINYSSARTKTGVDGEGHYKIKDDARITGFGRFLRRTSLDELPQLLNVLKGEMSLVGPRPAIPYEVEVYRTWHRQRLLAAKPGMTGIWQVTGRSRVKFDEMVRMDLRYAMAWSLWLDLKILLLTPVAVIRGTGAL